jgi:acetyl esterase
MYLAETDRQHPEASPLWRDDFTAFRQCTSLPLSTIRLCDEGEMLYQHLTEQGVTCTAQRWLGVIHGFFQLGGVSQSARDVMRDIAGRIQHARGA